MNYYVNQQANELHSAHFRRFRGAALNPFDSGHIKLLKLYIMLRGILSAGAIAAALYIVLDRLKLSNPSGRLSGLSTSYKYALLALGALVGFILLIYLLSGIFAPLCRAKRRFCVGMCRVLCALCALGYIVLALGILLLGNRIIDQLSVQTLFEASDTALLRLLALSAGMTLIFAAFVDFGLFYALKGASMGKFRRRGLAVSAMFALCETVCISAFALAVYLRILGNAQVFSYALSQILPVKLDTAHLPIALLICEIIALKPLLIMAGGVCGIKNGAPRTVSASLGIVALYMTLMGFLREFIVVLSRYSLYSRLISTMTLIKHPLCALGCLIIIAALLARRRNLPIALGALIVSGTKIWVLVSEKPYVTFKSFDAAFETALPHLWAIMWGLTGAFALIAAVLTLIFKRPMPKAPRVIFAIIAIIPLTLSAIYYIENLKYMIDRQNALTIAEAFISSCIIPALALGMVSLNTGKGD